MARRIQHYIRIPGTGNILLPGNELDFDQGILWIELPRLCEYTPHRSARCRADSGYLQDVAEKVSERVSECVCVIEGELIHFAPNCRC